MADDRAIARLAGQVRKALAGASLADFAELLDPNVTWGEAGQQAGCHNRRQVLQWYERGQTQGRRADVRDVTVHGDKILVALTVNDPGSDAKSVDRWQILTVTDGKVSDIQGYDHPPALGG